MNKRHFVVLSLLILLILSITACDRVFSDNDENLTAYFPIIIQPLPLGSWQVIETVGSPIPRHENGFVQVNGKFYLLGGRGIKKVEVFNPADSTWSKNRNTPLEMHHFQAVTIDGKIYVVGAWTGPFPYEENIPYIYIYDPTTDEWQIGPEIPSHRARGSAGVVVRDGKIYMLGGAVGGHGPHATTVNWFDEYDPILDEWVELPGAPNARDHFHASIVGNRLYAVGGRISGADNFQNQTIAGVDVYDFNTSSWSTLPSPDGDIPTERGGSMTSFIGNEIIVTGGEGFGLAWPETEALDVTTLKWRELAPLVQARHGTQIAECNGGLYTVGGAGRQGGVPELDTLEVFFMEGATPCEPTEVE